MMTMVKQILAATVMFTSVAAAQPAASDQQILDELRKLRIELMEDLLERRAERLEALEVELARVRAERLRLENAIRVQQEDSRNWRQEMQSAEHSAGERAQLETARAAEEAESARRLGRERNAAAEREAGLDARLTRERERHRRLGESLRGLQQSR
jgi:hypothetical protein